MSKPDQKQLVQRLDAMVRWLDDHAPYAAIDQKHLDQFSMAQAYWTLGYATALRDVIENTKDLTENDTPDTSS